MGHLLVSSVSEAHKAAAKRLPTEALFFNSKTPPTFAQPTDKGVHSFQQRSPQLATVMMKRHITHRTAPAAATLAPRFFSCPTN
ncbi:MAG: hypothetical protein IPK82_33900 [Polyangiaceae bacterium]|nr:hypothetical protein [Polyangiaceae bacterium]